MLSFKTLTAKGALDLPDCCQVAVTMSILWKKIIAKKGWIWSSRSSGYVKNLVCVLLASAAKYGCLAFVSDQLSSKYYWLDTWTGCAS